MNALTLPPDVAVFSRGALEFLRPPTQEEWSQIGRYVVASRTCSLRWIADWRRVGRREFGDEFVQAEEQQLELQFKDLRAAEALEAMEGGAAAAASDEHAYVVARLCNGGEEAAHWIAQANEHNLSAHELQRSIKFGAVVKDTDENVEISDSDKSVGITTIEGIATKFELWLKKVSESGFPEDWDAERLKKVRALLNPMRETASKISILILQRGEG